MNSELEAIMRRRRRKADGLPSPSPSKKKDAAEDTSRSKDGPPPMIPPSSIPMMRRSTKPLSMRRSIPPPPPPTSPTITADASMRRRALEHIRGSRRAAATSGASYNSDNTQTNDDVVSAAATTTASSIPAPPGHVRDDSLNMQGVLHDFSKVNEAGAAAFNDSFDKVPPAVAKNQADLQNDSALETNVGVAPNDSFPNDSVLMTNVGVAPIYTSVQNDSMVTNIGDPGDEMIDVPNDSIVVPPEEAVIESPRDARPEYQPSDVIGSPGDDDSSVGTPSEHDSSVGTPSEHDSSVVPPSEQDSSVEPSSEQEPKASGEVEPSSSSEEGVHASFGEKLSEEAFASFEATFAAFPAFEQDIAPFEAAYEPPPAFEAFVPMEEVDYSPIPDPPKRAAPKISFRQARIVSGDDSAYYCPPVTNPLTGNIIQCRSVKGDVLIQEIELQNSSQVMSTLILTPDVQRRFKTSYGSSTCGVAKVLSLTTGVHRSQGQARVRVAALVDFYTISQMGKRVARTVLVIWQWGYASTKSVALQSLLSPPSKGSFTYDALSLRMADGLVFLAGTAKGKGPCVFCVKPTVKDVWSAEMLPGSGDVSCLAVTSHPNRKFKYVAIAQADGQVSVWTYQGALDRKGADVSKTLFPLCRLDGTTAIGSLDDGGAIEDDGMPDPKKGQCTSLEWIPPGASLSNMMLLAAAYTSGMAVFHVSLPLLTEGDDVGAGRPIPSPTASTQLSQTLMLAPFTAARWPLLMTKASASWLDVGPHTSPCLAFLLERDSSVEVTMGVINMPMHGSAGATKGYLCPFTTLCTTSIQALTGEKASGLLSSQSVSSVVLYSTGAVLTLSPVLSTDDSYFASIRGATTSAPPGLDSAGYVTLPDTENDDEGVLNVFTLRYCQREVSDQQSMGEKRQRLDWTPPTTRHLLCRSFVGDTKNAQEPSSEAQSAPDFSHDENITGGSHTSVVCDLDLGSNLVPRRIVRCKGTGLCAILLHRDLGHQDGPSTDAVSFVLVDTRNKKVVGVRDGRDIAFLPNTKPGHERALVLSADGSRIHMLCRTLESGEFKDSESEESKDGESEISKDSEWEEGSEYRALLGVESNEDYIECCRLLILSSGSKASLLAVGTRARDEHSCVIHNDALVEFDSDSWNKAIPSVKTNVCWFGPKETVQSLAILPSYQDGQRLIAAATGTRVMLLSTSMTILTQVSTKLSSCALASLGSHTVAFCCTDWKIRYLCSLDDKFSTGRIATLPVPSFGYAAYHLTALRPERFLYSKRHSGTRLLENGDNADSFLLPVAVTRPVLLLEPMVANALCEAENPGDSTALLRSIIERFGRKVAPFPHGDDEGIGSAGSGLTPAVFEMLSFYGLKHPASWLLTGSSFQRSVNSRVLPPWMAVSSKVDAALNRDAYLHIISSGDQYFSDYVRSPDQNMASTLPRPSDPSALACHELARRAMQDGDVAGALKLLDVAGTSSADSELLNLALSSQLDPSRDVAKVLKALSGQGEEGNVRATSNVGSTSSLAALVMNLKSRQVNDKKIPQKDGECEVMSEEFRRKWMTQLAPSIQRRSLVQRTRHRLIGEDATTRAAKTTEVVESDRLWLAPCNESKHVWNEGPARDKENLLLLDSIEEWLGRRRPAILGKEGAQLALERGEKTLADILNRAQDYDDDDSFGGQIDAGAMKDGWMEGVGEGRTDEDNLCAYFRMSEGADEDSAWRSEGLVDLTQYSNKAILIGGEQSFALQPTSSSVDEGEPGKVKLLYDLVFEESGSCGLVLEATRGSSLDVGLLHGPAQKMRRRCSLEFWYRLPPAEAVSGEIVLARRSVCAPADDLARMCLADEKDGFLWELVLLGTGELEFRTNGGTSLLSTSESSSEFEQNQAMGDFGDDMGDSDEDGGLVSWGRSDGIGGWNHVCLVFSSRHHDSSTDCSVKMLMKGVKVASAVASILPPGLDGSDLADASLVDEAMKKTVYLFGLNAPSSYRMTELRLWSCDRNESDIKMMMYEYLRAAETKKKIKVKIRNMRDGTSSAIKPTKGSALSPPKESSRGTKGLLPPPQYTRQRTNTETSSSSQPEEDSKFAFDASFRAFASPKSEGSDGGHEEVSPPSKESHSDTQADIAADASREISPEAASRTTVQSDVEDYRFGAIPSSPPEEKTITRDVSFGLPLSSQVRSSAAAALVRGPPATRHFGGNRGGLSRATPGDRSTMKRFGVGAIAICGAEKTVVFSHDQSPPGKTYPIGASGAVISDEMDDDGSEYLCCFLAKDKRMVVFELQSKSVVVELQMTTKLNFWRYLPPQAHGHTLVFMLITPVGGFHWVPLDESPRPRQVWKRGPDLQGKKIVTYEEGGSNGFGGPDALSAVALLLVSTASSGTPLEAWILQVGGESQALCISSNVLGAALFRPYHIEDEAFLPHLVTAHRVESEIVIKVEPLVQDPSTGELAVAEISIGAIIDLSSVRRVVFAPPGLAMGGWPEVICCSCEGIIVACVRRKGLVVAYDCQEELLLIRQDHIGNYIVDAAVRKGLGDVDVELVLLVADSENPRDGSVVSINIRR